MAVLVVVAAVRLAKQSIDVLMDRTVADADERIRAALAQADERSSCGACACARRPGATSSTSWWACRSDTGVTPGARGRGRRSRTWSSARSAGADVVVHVEPTEAEGDVRERATAAASRVPEVREVHNVRVMRLPDGYELSLHVKLPRDLSLDEAHDAVERLEQRVRAEVPELRNVHTHIEPLARIDWASAPASDETAEEREAIESAVRRFTGAAPLAVASATASRAASRS